MDKPFLYTFKWSICWTLLILILCFLPGKSIPNSQFFDIFQLDKWVHAFLFLILYLIIAFEIKNYTNTFFTRSKAILYTCIFCILLAASTELIQHYLIADRYGDILDFIANIVGINLGFLSSIFYKKSNKI